jgi:hypothetical protein
MTLSYNQIEEVNEILYMIVEDPIINRAAMDVLRRIDINNPGQIPKDIQDKIDVLCTRTFVTSTMYIEKIISAYKNSQIRGDDYGIRKCRETRKNRYITALTLAFEAFEMLNMIYKLEDYQRRISILIGIILHSVNAAYKLMPSATILLSIYNLNKIFGRNETAYILLCSSMDHMPDVIPVYTFFNKTHEHMWLCKFLTLTNIQECSVIKLIEYVKERKSFNENIIVSYLINTNYKHNSNTLRTLFTNILDRIKYNKEQYESTQYPRETMNALVQSNIRLYISALRMMIYFDVKLKWHDSDKLLACEQMIMMYVLSNYIVGENNNAYKICKLLMRLDPKILTEHQKKILIVLGDKLYAPDGVGYAKTYDAFYSRSGGQGNLGLGKDV